MTSNICKNGHQFEKASDCRTCPTCTKREMVIAYKKGFPKIGSPAYYALKNEGITLDDLPKYTEKQLLTMHGVGPKAIRILKQYLESSGKSFANN